MKFTKLAFTAALACSVLTGSVVLASGQGNGKAKGHDKQKNEADEDENGNGNGNGKGKGKGHNKHYYQGQDRQAAHGWYSEHEGHLPPGLAKKDRLPPGLQRQLDARGTLPPGLQKRIQPVPRDLEVRLAPPPPECAHVVIGGNIVLLNRRTNVVVDVVLFD